MHFKKITLVAVGRADWRGQSGYGEISWENVAIVKVRDDGSLDQMMEVKIEVPGIFWG